MTGRVIFGQETVINETLVTLLAGGHALLIGVPSLAKTRLVETLGTVLGLADKRVQFPLDLMPAGILGSEVLEEAAGGPHLVHIRDINANMGKLWLDHDPFSCRRGRRYASVLRK